MTRCGGGRLGLLDLARLLGLGHQARLLDFLGLLLQGHVETLGRLDLIEHGEPPLLELGRQDEIADEHLLQDDPALGQTLSRLGRGDRRKLLALLGNQLRHLVARGGGAERGKENRGDELDVRAGREGRPLREQSAAVHGPARLDGDLGEHALLRRHLELPLLSREELVGDPDRMNLVEGRRPEMRSGLEDFERAGEPVGADADEARRHALEALLRLAPGGDRREDQEDEEEGAACGRGSPGNARRHPRNARERVAERPGPFRFRLRASGLLGLG